MKCGYKLEKSDILNKPDNIAEICPSCGAENKEKKNFCTKCGTSLSKKQPLSSIKRTKKPTRKSGTFRKFAFATILLCLVGFGAYYIINSLDLFPKYDLIYGANVPIKIYDDKLAKKDLTAKEIQNYDQLPAPKNSSLLSAVELKPKGLEIPNGVSVSFPLNEKLNPGTVLPIGYLDEESDRWLETGNYCYVDPSGKRAVGTVFHFSIFGPLRTRVYMQEREAYNTEWMWIFSQYGRMLDDLNEVVTEKYRSPLGIGGKKIDMISWLIEDDYLIPPKDILAKSFSRSVQLNYLKITNTECLAAARAEFSSRKKKLDDALKAALTNWHKAASKNEINSVVALWAVAADLLTLKQQKFRSLSSRAKYYIKRKTIEGFADILKDFVKGGVNFFIEAFFSKPTKYIYKALSNIYSKIVGDEVKKQAEDFLVDNLIELNPEKIEKMAKKLMDEADKLAFKLSGVPENSQYAGLQGDIAQSYKYHTSHVLLYIYPYLLQEKRWSLPVYYNQGSDFKPEITIRLNAKEMEPTTDVSRPPLDPSKSVILYDFNSNISEVRKKYKNYKTKLLDEITKGSEAWDKLDKLSQSDKEDEKLKGLVASRLLKHDIDKFLASNVDRFIKKHFIEFLSGNLDVPYLKETTGIEVPNVRDISIQALVAILFPEATIATAVVLKIVGAYGSVFQDALTAAWDFASPDKIQQLSDELDKKSIKLALKIKPLEINKIFSKDKGLYDIVEISNEYPPACPPPEWKLLIQGDFHDEIDPIFDPEEEVYYSMNLGAEAKASGEELEKRGISSIKLMIDVGVFGREFSIGTYNELVKKYDKDYSNVNHNTDFESKKRRRMTPWTKELAKNGVGTIFTRIYHDKYRMQAFHIIDDSIVEINVAGTSSNRQVVENMHDYLYNKLKSFIPRMRAGRDPNVIFSQRFPNKDNPFPSSTDEENPEQ